LENFELRHLKKAEVLSKASELKLKSGTSYINFYRNQFVSFATENHVKSVYEPFGLRFVCEQNSKHPFELIFAVTPIGDFLQTFGYDGALTTIHDINSKAYDGILSLYSTFTKNVSSLSSWKTSFLTNHQFPKEVFDNKDFLNASRTLMNIGTSTVLYGMIKSSVKSLTSALLPGFVDTTQAAISRSFPQISPTDAVVAEAIGVTPINYFLKEMVKSSSKSPVNMELFFFYLALLFVNTDSFFLSFHEDNDSFTNNLHLLPVAIGTLLELKDILFNNPSRKDLESALELFFAVLAALSEIKKEKDAESYEPFVILMDHFPYFINGLEYGIIEHAFPFTIIRSAYNKINKEPEIFKCILREDIDAVKNILDKDSSKIEEKNSYGDTPLIAAIRESNIKIAKLLFDRGANITAKNNSGDTPFHVAIRLGNTEFIQPFFDKNIDPNIKGKNGESPLQMTKNEEVIKLLKKYGSKI